MEDLKDKLSAAIGGVASAYTLREVRKALRAILREEYPGTTRCSNEDVLVAARAVGGAFTARQIAEKVGCSRQRVVRIVRNCGARDVAKGVYEFPRNLEA